jgi:phytanoyl-CoA hydroxylase
VYRSYITLPLFNDVTKKLCGDARVECDDVVSISVVRTMFFNKPANQGVTIDWQCVRVWSTCIAPSSTDCCVQLCSQDVGEDALRSVTIWTALDRTTVANGALQVVPGSHVRGRLETRPWKGAPQNTIAESIPVPIQWMP